MSPTSHIPEPQYAPGDPVLIAGTVVRAYPDDELLVAARSMGGSQADIRTVHLLSPAADVHPVPLAPDPRDTAIAAVRALHFPHHPEGTYAECMHDHQDWPCPTRRALDGVVPVPAPPVADPRDTAIAAVRALHYEDDGQCVVCRDENDNPQDWPCQTSAALDGVAPVPAPPAPTPTGWTAEGQAEAAAREYLLSDYIPPGEMADQPGVGPTVAFIGGYVRGHGAATAAVVRARRAEEAAAAAPALSGHRCDNCNAVAVGTCAFNPYRAADDAAERAAAAAPATTDDDRVARALHRDGAWCGNCEFEGWDTCEDCREVCRRYAATAHRAAGSPS